MLPILVNYNYRQIRYGPRSPVTTVAAAGAAAAAAAASDANDVSHVCLSVVDASVACQSPWWRVTPFNALSLVEPAGSNGARFILNRDARAFDHCAGAPLSTCRSTAADRLAIHSGDCVASLSSHQAISHES